MENEMGGFENPNIHVVLLTIQKEQYQLQQE